MDHFDSVADVNEWDGAAKKKWIRARLTGRAATAFKRLPEADRATFDKIVAALKKRFEPECRKELFMAEFQGRKKRRTEDWAAYGEDLKMLVEKAYPALQAEAQELLALNHFLAQIDNPQVAFGVRQKAPSTIDAAVAATMELEMYLHPTSIGREEHVIAAAGRMRSSEGGARDMDMVLERLERLEARLTATQGVVFGENTDLSSRQRRRSNQKGLTCWVCREEGHFSRDCPSRRDGEREVVGAVGVVNVSTVNVVSEVPAASSGCSCVASVNNQNAICQVDTGAPVSLISKDLLDKIENEGEQQPLSSAGYELVGVQGVPIKLYGSTRVEVKFDRVEKTYFVEVLVAESITTDIILGRDFLQQHECCIQFGERDKLHFMRDGHLVELGHTSKKTSVEDLPVGTSAAHSCVSSVTVQCCQTRESSTKHQQEQKKLRINTLGILAKNQMEINDEIWLLELTDRHTKRHERNLGKEDVGWHSTRITLPRNKKPPDRSLEKKGTNSGRILMEKGVV